MRGKLTVLFGGYLLCGGLAISAQNIAVGPNVHVSKVYPDRQHYETQVATDPTHPERLIGCSIIAPAEKERSPVDHKTVVYVSGDGGKSWEPTLEIGPGLISRDPSCIFGADGTAYFAAFGFPADTQAQPKPSGKSRSKTWVYRSNDGGKTWLQPTVLPIIDRDFLTVDNGSPKYKGRVYLTGIAGMKPLDDKRSLSVETVFRSLDGGQTFEEPVRLASTNNHHLIGSGNGVVLSDGTLLSPYAEIKSFWREGGSFGIPENKPGESNASLKVVTSADGGQSFSDAVIASDWYLRFYGTISDMPSVAVDQSQGPFQDRVYIVWADLRSGRGEVLLVSSSDKGKTWSKPLVVNDDWWPANAGGGPDHTMPEVAVNSAGVVGIMWYDRRDSPDNNGWWVRFAASMDGGDTFLPSVKVSEAPQSLDPARLPVLDTETHPGGSPAAGGAVLDSQIYLSAFWFMGGDTAGLAADSSGRFHPFWIDNRTGIPQVWTATVSVEGRARHQGSVDLDDLADVTDLVMLEFENCRYDAGAGTVSAEAYVINKSEKTLKGPMRVKVLSIESTVGMPQILNSDNQLKRSGAVLDFSSLLDHDALAPGARSRPKPIQVRLSDPKLFHPVVESRYAVSFANIKAKVFAKETVASSSTANR